MAQIEESSNIPALSATDLVLDLLEAHDEHQLSVAALCRGGQVFGMREQNLRVALTRLSRQGKVASPARGFYALNSAGKGLLHDVENWLRREQQTVPWQGGWMAVSDASVPRRDKAVRRHHERALALRGFAELREGLRLRPDNLHGGVAAVREDLLGLGMAPSAVVMAAGELSDRDERAARALWDQAALKREYATLLAKLERSGARLDALAPEAAARESLLLGRAAIRCILHDPLLPDTLMGGDLRHRLIETMRDYQTRAKAVWLALLS